MIVDEQAWQQRLDEAARARRVPGASLAVLAGGEVTTLATGVLNRATGVETTVDSVFQIGSITKVWTTTLLMQLVAEGQLALDTKVLDVLPGFRVADPDVTKQVTVRHLVTHTSGIDGDVFIDTGRGDECVQRYVDRLTDAVQIHPIDATLSYCNSAFVVAGRIIEVLAGQVWDQALHDRLVEPLGLTHTMTLPEEALRFRAAMGHIGKPGAQPAPAPVWGLMRSAGPAGLITATASDVITFARMHLDGGVNQAGDEILRPDLVARMQQLEADVPNPSRRADHWALGWWLCDWGGRTIYGHDGGTIGQSAFLRVDPISQVAVALLTNGGDTPGIFEDVFGWLFDELAGIKVAQFSPPVEHPAGDAAGAVGIYERSSERITVTETPDGLHALVEEKGELAAVSPPEELDLIAASEDVWATQSEPGGPWSAWRFFSIPDGTRYVHAGMRATPKVL